MSLRLALKVVNDMEAAGVIDRYAVAGAVAAFNYVEPASTQDLDVPVSFRRGKQDRLAALATLDPIPDRLAKRSFAEKPEWLERTKADFDTLRELRRRRRAAASGCEARPATASAPLWSKST